MSLAALADFARAGFVDEGKERAAAQSFVDRFRIRTPSLAQQIKNLSGGNQQKVLLARWLMRGLKVIVVDEPTRGIDVGAKSEIFALIDRLAGEGLAVVMMTSEMPELLGLSDRIIVMAEGRLTATFARRSGDAGDDPQCRDRLAQRSPRPAAARRSTPSRSLTRGNEIALVVCLAAIILFFALTADHFFTLRNMTNVLGQASLALVAGIGVAIVFISGEVDISVGSLQAAIALPLIVIMNHTESLGLGIAGAVALGLAVGIVNGYLSAYVGINSLIVTLGMLFVLRGGVYLYTGKTAIPDEAALDSFFKIGNSSFLGVVPYPAIVAFVLLIVFIYVMRYRPFGRHVYAVGGNAEVARLAGFNVRRIKFTCFIISALLATVSGILLASRLGSAVHLAGLGFEFQVVAAVVLGGVSLSGGVGSLLGMALGVLILQFLSNGLGMLDLATEWQLVITGIVIILAVAFDELKRRQAG